MTSSAACSGGERPGRFAQRLQGNDFTVTSRYPGLTEEGFAENTGNAIEMSPYLRNQPPVRNPSSWRGQRRIMGGGAVKADRGNEIGGCQRYV